LAILGHFEPNRVEEIAEMILEKIKDLTLETSEHQKYVLQLEMISKLRGLQFLIAQKIQDMAIQYNLRDDLRYLQGVEQGKLEGELKGKLEGQKETLQAICQRMYKLGLSTAEIAEMIGLTEEQVQSFIPQ
jgi:predicted transposase YdaD